jgi:phosphatidylglycerophosphatase A
MTTSKKTGTFWGTNPFIKQGIIGLCSCFRVGQFSMLAGNLIAGSFGLLAYRLTRDLSGFYQVIIFLFAALIVALASNKYEKFRSSKELLPSILIDKAFGVWLSLFLIWDISLLTTLVALSIFTFLNYYKPFPINIFYSFKKGRGVLADDLSAGIITNIIIRIMITKGLL